jgi:hypothetical protein
MIQTYSTFTVTLFLLAIAMLLLLLYQGFAAGAA